jgi:hypothetical protein
MTSRALFLLIPMLHGCCCCLGPPPRDRTTERAAVEPATDQPAATPKFTPTTDPRPSAARAVMWMDPESGTPVEIGWYEVLDREAEDTPLKTQVEVRILVNEDATGERLRKVLEAVYTSISSESGFKYHPHPNSIWVFAYAARKWQDDPTGWVAKVQQAAADKGPTYDIKEGRGDLDSTDFDARVGAACPAANEACLPDATAKSVRIVQVAPDDEDEVSRKFDLWFGVFFGQDSLFERLPDLDKATFEYTDNGTVVVTLDIDRATNKALDWDGSQAAVGRKEQELGERVDRGEITYEQHEELRFAAYLSQYRALLKKVPKKQVAKGWEP